MSDNWRLIGMMAAVGALALVALIGWLTLHYVGRRKRLIAERALVARQMAEKAAAEQAESEMAQ